MEFLGAAFAVMRDLAILAAAISLARWAWDAHAQGPLLRDTAARAAIDGERLAADLRQRAARLESFAAELATRLDELIGKARDSELRARLKSRIHGMLHATTDPYLSFAEIAAAMRAAGEPFDVGGAGSEPASDGPITQRDVELRRALIELIEAQAIAQLAGDRYFIASEFETDADDA